MGGLGSKGNDLADKDYTKAIELLLKKVDFNKDDFYLGYLTESWKEQAITTNSDELALDNLNRVIELDPADERAYVLRANRKLEMGLRPCSDYKKACDLDPEKHKDKYYQEINSGTNPIIAELRASNWACYNYNAICLNKYPEYKLEAVWEAYYDDYYKIYNNDNKYPSQKLTVINEDGMQYILISIGGRSYKYLIDTGASDMTINNTMKETFVRKGILKKSDFRSVKYKVANGETITMQRGILKSMKINNNTFYNVNVAVGNSNTPLLLGKSFLNRYDWRLNSDELELKNK
jgi:clan AA aspartic protease (TIGR02281 family)